MYVYVLHVLLNLFLLFNSLKKKKKSVVFKEIKLFFFFLSNSKKEIKLEDECHIQNQLNFYLVLIISILI